MPAPSLTPFSSDMPRPKVSVVMPTYNRAEYLRQAAQMILDQTLGDLELIISDDHSTDETPQVAQHFIAVDPRVRYHRLSEKGGINRVLNEAFDISRGKYIQICHDHDIYLPQLSEKMADLLDMYSSVVFVHPGRQGCDHLGNPNPNAYFVCGYPIVSPGLAWKKKMLTRLASPVTGLSMIRRSSLEQVGLLDPDFGACSDIDLWMRLCEIGDVGYVNELLLYVRGRDPSHPYAGYNWEITDQVIRIHRKHLPLVYQGKFFIYWKVRRELEIDLSLLVDYMNSRRHRWWKDVENGRRYLRAHGGLLSKTAAYLL